MKNLESYWVIVFEVEVTIFAKNNKPIKFGIAMSAFPIFPRFQTILMY